MVLMDLQMPVLDGYQACAAWRRHEQLHGGRACMVGVSADGAHAPGDWRAAGLDAMLEKPMHPATLGALLARWLGHPAA
jgi:two-component system sensor histidine kinase/response regulator